VTRLRSRRIARQMQAGNRSGKGTTVDSRICLNQRCELG
jgi:hypothetical protein